jgi:hypothetical protein
MDMSAEEFTYEFEKFAAEHSWICFGMFGFRLLRQPFFMVVNGKGLLSFDRK